MLIVVGGIKGGSGKTTIATNLVVMRAKQGYKVLFVDADEQKSASDWVEQRQCSEFEAEWTTVQLGGDSIHLQLQRMLSDYDDIIVDVGGRNTTSQASAISVCDVLIVPFKPRSLDIWTLGKVKALISQIKIVNPDLISISVINQGDARGSDNEDTIDLLRDCTEMVCCPHSIGHRKAFANAASEGLSVMEMEDSKAKHEMRLVYEYIFNTYISHISHI